MPALRPPLSHTNFSLNAWGLAGIFGGEEAISAMALIPLYRNRRWLGWYNAPGSLEVARHFGRFAYSKYSEQTYPSKNNSAAQLFGLDGHVGPRYTAALSGTEMWTGHLGYLMVDRCKEVTEVTEIKGRETRPAHVALIDLGDVDYDQSLPHLPKIDAFLDLIPIIVSIVTCVLCAVVYDWYCFSTILIGILASGFASMTIGGSSRPFLMSVKNPAHGAPSGNGILVPAPLEDVVVVVKGQEHAVNAITKGKFGLYRTYHGVSHYALLTSPLLLVMETMAQLFLIPQGSLFGQLMFVISLCVSWVHNFRISLLNREKLQTDILFQKLGDPKIRKFLVGTRTTMAVLVTFLVFHGVSSPSPHDVAKILRILLSNDTVVWEKWRKKVVQQVCDQSLSCLKLDEEDNDLTEAEKSLLDTLLGDASTAFDGYLTEEEPFGKSA